MLTVHQLQQFIEQTSLRQLRTPYMLTDLQMIRDRCRTFRKCLPQVRLYYAVKCFDDPQVIAAVDSLVDGFDVASIKEVERLIDLGISPSRLTFSNPVKSEEAIRKATELGAKRFAFQSYNELVKITKAAPHAEVYARVKMDDSKGAITFSSKFGCAPEEAVELLKAASQLSLRPVGVTFHVGSQAVDIAAWSAAVSKAQSILVQARREGLAVSLINLGGGFPVQYSLNDPTLHDIAVSIKNEMRKTRENLRYMAEPGRFLTADSSVIVTSIIGVENRDDHTWLYLDVGVFHAFMEVFEFGKFPYPVYSLSHLQKKVTTRKHGNYVLTGPTCDSYDTMAFKVKLPHDLSVGDKLLITMTGSYTVVYGSDFNGFKVPPRHFIDSSQVVRSR